VAKKNPASGGVIRVFVVVANPVSARASVCGGLLFLLFLPLLLLIVGLFFFLWASSGYDVW
jgi:hypothetical protein